MISGYSTHRSATAFHEAGHALAALREGYPVVRVGVYVDSPGGFTQLRHTHEHLRLLNLCPPPR